MTIAIHVVINLAVVRYLAVGSIDPVLIPQPICLVGSIPRAKGGTVLEGAVEPVYAGVTHAHRLALPLQPCKQSSACHEAEDELWQHALQAYSTLQLGYRVSSHTRSAKILPLLIWSPTLNQVLPRMASGKDLLA